MNDPQATGSKHNARTAWAWFSASAWLAVFILGLAPATGLGAQPLATLRYEILGTQLQVSPVAVSVPKGIAGSVLAQLTTAAGSTSGADPAIASGANLEAILRGPAFPARRLVGRPGEALLLPPINLAGEYQLDGIRLVDAATGATRLEGVPSSVPVHVFDQVLVSSVTSRPLTMEEITDRGIVIDANNFRAVEFEVGFVLDGQTIPVKLAVVAPDFTQSTELIPADEIYGRLVEARIVNDQLSQQLVDSERFPAELRRPGLNIQIKGANFQVSDPEEASLGLTIPPIPALMVIPGNIGYLNQFFSVQVFTENASPAGSGLSVSDLTATLRLPPGPDGILSTNYVAPGDDPLRFARVGSQAETHDTLPLFGPAPALTTRFYPGQSGSTEFLVEGLQEGLHVLDLDLRANLDGLAAGSIRIAGKAAGSILVRNPRFSLAFSHPKTIRSGEPYSAYVTVLNTGSNVANLVSINLRGASISGGTLQSDEVVELGSIAPGQSATATFRVEARRTGSIKFSNLTTGEHSVQGRFNLTMGIDERGVELSPDTIGLPDDASLLPSTVLDTANRVLGQALSAATAPLLPPGVKPVSRATLTRRVLELAEAGQRIKYSDPTNRVLVDLLLDWQGGRVADDLVKQQIRVGDEFLSEAARAPVLDQGFDQILQTTEAGRQFRTAILQAAEASDSIPADATARLRERAPHLAGRGESWLLASSSDAGLETEGSHAGFLATAERSDLEGAAVYPGRRGGWLVVRGGAGTVRWTASSAVPTADLAVVLLGANGAGQSWKWTVQNLPAGACLRFDPGSPAAGMARDDDCDGTPDEFLVAAWEPVTELAPEILAVVQDTDVVLSRPDPHCTLGPARNYGHLVGILFSKPMVQAKASIATAYRLDNGTHASHVQMQPGGRVALVSLREGVSALRPRLLTASGITDERGNAIVSDPHQVETDFQDGVAVRGRVLRADGTPAAGVPVTVTMNDLRRDPSDCPLVSTRVAQKYTDADGLFDFDFVLAGVPFTIAAVDTGGLSAEAIQTILGSTVGDRFAAEKLAALAAATNVLATLGVGNLAQATRLIEGLDRAVWQDQVEYEGARMGQEIVVGLRFRGRAVVTGTVVEADGITPVANAAVNLFPAPDSRELGRGMFTDSRGRFEFNGVPLGQFTINVQNRQRNFRTVAGNLIQAGTTNDVTVVLTPPDVHETVRSSLRGRVIEPDGVTGHAQARVYVVLAAIGVVAAATTDNGGFWRVDDIPVGTVEIRAVSRDGRRRGLGRGEVIPSAVSFVLASLNGTGTVVGRVEWSDGLPVTNALVAGGVTLVRTDADGRFRLTDVPQGPTTLAAGVEAGGARGGFPRVAQRPLTVLPEVENSVVIRFSAVGRIIGQVRDARGNPVTGVPVALPVAGGFAWAKLDGAGRFEFPNLPPGDYIVSAPSPPVAEEDVEKILDQASGDAEDQIAAALQQAVTAINRVVSRRLGDGPTVTPGSFGWTPVSLRSDGETAIANIQYLPEGRVEGTVRNDRGVPIGTAVRLTGQGLDRAGRPATVILGNATSDPANGAFTFPRLPLGSWALQAASPFYPLVLVEQGFTTPDQLDLTNVVLQFPPIAESNGRLVGQVLMPDDSPAGAGVKVRISFGNDYEITTDENGQFDTQFKLPANGYTVEANDPSTGLRGQVRVLVKAGITNSTVVPLLGKGALELRVYHAGGAPAVNASVKVTMATFPGGEFADHTDGNGRFFLDNLFAGRYGLAVNFITAGGHLEGNVIIPVDAGTTQTATLTLGPTATIRGVFRKRDDGSPVANAKVTVGSAGVANTDSAGAFEVRGLPLGAYKVVAREPVSGRTALASAVLSFEGQIVEVTLTELAQGELRGTVFRSGEPRPIAGATVTLSQDASLASTVTVTTGPDGAFSFPAAIPGAFTLTANKLDEDGRPSSRSVLGIYPENTPSLTVDVTLPARTVYGRVTVQVHEPDGVTPVVNALVNSTYSTDGLGQVVLDHLTLGTQIFRARSTLPGQTSSAGKSSVVLTTAQTNLTCVITLSGVGRVQGRVVEADGVTPVAGAEVEAEGRAFDVVRTAQVITDPAGAFTLENLPLAPIRLSAISGSLGAAGSTTLTNHAQTVEVVLRLGGSGSILGRLLRADGITPVVNESVVLTFAAPSGLDGIVTVHTDVEGRFRFGSIPVGTNALVAVSQAFDGLAKRRPVISANDQVMDLGDIYLHEAWPEVVAIRPESGAQSASTTPPIDLTFSEPIATNTIVASGIYLRGPSDIVPCDLSWETPPNGEPGTRVVHLKPRAELQSQVTYRVFVLAGALIDGLGRPIGQGPLSLVDRPLLTPFTSSFSTRDAVVPSLVSIQPAPGSTQSDPGTPVRLSFSEPIAAEGLSFTLSGPGGKVTGTVALVVNGTVLSFTPSQPLTINSAYTLLVDGIRDLAGNPLANLPIATSFNTLDTLGPALSVLRLAHGQTPVAGASVLLETLLATPEEGVAVRITANLDPLGVATNDPFQWPVTLPSAGPITYRAAAIDRFGNEGPMIEYAPTLVPNQAPVISLLRNSPAGDVLLSSQRFSVAATATDDVRVADIALAVSGALDLVTHVPGDTSTPLEFVVPAGAVAGTTLHIQAQAVDVLGEPSTVATLDYTIADGTPPSLSVLSPADQTELNADALLDIEVASSDNSTNLNLELVLSGAVTQTQTVAVALSPGQWVTNTFSASLAGVSRNGASLTAVLRAVDEAGNATAVTRAFTIPDTQPPRLLSVLPTNGAPRQSLWLDSVSFRFDEALAPATVSANTVSFTNQAGILIPYHVQAGGTLVRVLPDQLPLPPGVTFTNLFSPTLGDASGNPWIDQDGHPPPADGQAYTFTTAAILGTTPTNHTPVVAGATLAVRVDFEPGLGATAFSFALNDQAPVNVTVSGNASQVTTALTLAANDTTGVLRISARRAGLPPYDMPDLILDVRPVAGDEDGDGLPNGYELAQGLNPFLNDASLDPDGDALTNLLEFQLGTNPHQPDTDHDGLSDGEEIARGGCFDPLNPDADGDGLVDGADPSPCTVGVGVIIEAPSEISVSEGGFAQVNVRAVSDVGPIARFGFTPTDPPPLFAQLEDHRFTNSSTNGMASAILTISPTFDAAGTHVLTLRAMLAHGTEITTNLTVQVADNPDLQITRWLGNSNGNWNSPARWSAGLPDSTKVAVIDADGTYQVTINSPATAASLILGGNSGTQRLQQTFSTLTLTAASELRRNGVYQMTSGTVTGAGTLAVGGQMSWLGGTMAGSGQTVVGDGGRLTMSGSQTKSLGRPLQNSGVMEASGTGPSISSGGLIVNRPDGVMMAHDFFLGGTSGGALTNQGTFVAEGSGAVTLNVPFHNDGLVTLTNGTLNWNAGGFHSTALDVPAGATLNLRGTFGTAPGSVLGGAGMIRFIDGTHTFGGDFRPTQSATFGGGTITISNALPTGIITNAGAVLNLFADQRLDLLSFQRGTIAGSGDLKLDGQMLWSGGTMGGTGRLLIGSNASVQVLGSLQKNIGREVDNGGRMTLAGPGAVTLAAPIVNRPGGVLTMEDVLFGGAAGSFTNWGSWVARGANTIPVSLVNHGTLTVASGTSRWSALVWNRGTIAVSSASSLVLDSAAQLEPGSDWDGNGTVRFRGSLVLGAPVNFHQLTAIFEGFASITGPFGMANDAMGALVFNRTLIVPGDATLRGTMTLGANSISVTISNTLTLSLGAILNNPGVVRVGAFVDEGGTINGNPPELLSPGSPLPPVVQIELREQADGGGGSSVRAAASARLVVLRWKARPGDRFVVQFTTDLRTWSDRPAPVQEWMPGDFKADLPAEVGDTAFYRLRRY